jgi:hypothetical protein
MANDFYEKTELPAPIVDIYLMGSAANYNWTPDSDIDVHVIIDYAKLQMPQETAFKTVKTAGAQWNAEHNIFIKGHKVEMNLQNAAEQKPYVTGIYSLNKDQWLRKPFKTPFNLNRQVLKFQYETMKNYVNNAIRSGDREQMKAAKKYLDSYRQYGLDTYGELSYENIIYKMLRARGIIKQLKDFITQVYDKQMTVDEADSEDIRRTHHFDQMQGAIQSKVDKGMELWKQSGLEVGETLFTSRGTPVTIEDAGISVDKKGEPLVYVKYNDGHGEVHTSMYLNKLSYEDPMSVDEVSDKDIKQSIPSLNKSDSPEFGNPNVDRSYHDKMDMTKGFNINRLTLDELKALREKARRMMADDNEWRGLYAADFKAYDTEIKRRMGYINAPVTEGFGAGIPETDRLKVKNTDGSVRRWQIRSKDAPKTPKMPTEEFISEAAADYIVKSKHTPSESGKSIMDVLPDIITISKSGDLVSRIGDYLISKGWTFLDWNHQAVRYLNMVSSATVNNIGNYLRDHERGIKSKSKNDSADEFSQALKTRKKYGLDEDVYRMGASAPISPMGSRKDLYPTPIEDEIPSPLRKILGMAEKILDRKSAVKPFFEIEYVEDLIGDIISMDFPSATPDRVAPVIKEIVKWLARDYDIRKNGRRIGE